MKKIVVSNNLKNKLNDAIEPLKIEKEEFTKSLNNYKVKFNNSLSNKDFIVLNKHNKIIKMNYVNKARNIIKGIQENNKITYPSIEDGVDLKYECLENKLKESIVINKLQEDYQYDFELDIGDLTPFFNKENNTLELKDNDKVIYRLLSPYMEDNKKDFSDDCAYEIEQNENILNIKLTCSSEWINSPKRTLPIIIDPTIEINQSKENLIIKPITNFNEVEPYYDYTEIGWSGVDKLNQFGLKAHINIKNIIENTKDFVKVNKVEILIPIKNISFMYSELKIYAYTIEKMIDIQVVSKDYDTTNPLKFDITSLFNNNLEEVDLFIVCDRSKCEEQEEVEEYNLNSISPRSTFIYNYITTYINSTENANVNLLFSYSEKKKDNINDIELDVSIDNSNEMLINSRTGNVKCIHNNTFLKCNNLSLDVNHIYLAEYPVLLNNLINNFGLNWKLNVQQFLIKEKYNKTNNSKKIIYINDKGNEINFFEKWFYKKNDEKIYVDRENIYLDNSQKLKYNDGESVYDIENEIVNNDGLQLILGNNINNYKSLNNSKNLTYSIEFADKYIFKEITYNNSKGTLSLPFFVEYVDNVEKNIDYSEINYKTMLSIRGNQILNKGSKEFKILLKNNSTFISLDGIECIAKLNVIPESIIDFEKNDYYLTEDIYKVKEKIKSVKKSIKSVYYNYKKVRSVINQILAQKKYYDDNDLLNKEIFNIQHHLQNYNNKLLDLKYKANQVMVNDMLEKYIKKLQNKRNIIIFDCLYGGRVISNYEESDLNDIAKRYQDQYYNAYNYLMQYAQENNQYDIANAENEITNCSEKKQQNDYKLSIENIEKQLENYNNQIAIIFESIKKYEYNLNLVQKQLDILIEDQKRNVNDLIIDQNNNTLGFDGYGRLILIQDRFENKINIEFGYENDNENKLISIYTDSQKIKFNYDKETNLLSSLIDQKGRKINYFYDEQKKLIKIQDNDEQETVFDYTSFFKITNHLLQTIDIKKNDNILFVEKYVVNKEIDTKTVLSNNDDVIKVESYKYSILDNTTTITNLLNNKVETYVFENNKTSQENDKTITICEFNDNLLLRKKVYYKTFVENKVNSSSLTNDFIYIDLNDFKTIKNYKSFLLFVKRNKTSNTISNTTAELVIGGKNIKTGAIESLDTVTYSKTDDSQILKTIKLKNIDEISDITLKFETSEKNTITHIFLIPFTQIEYVYDSDKKLIQEENDDDLVTYEYNEHDLCIKKEQTSINNEKTITNYSYNSNNQITLIEDSKNNTVEYYYDEKENCIEQRSYNKNDASLMRVSKTQYDEKGNTINYGSIKNKDGNYPTQVIKCNDLNAEIKGFKNEVITYNYDFNTDELLSIASSAGGINNSTSFSYNYGLLTSMKHLGCEVKYAYDGLSRKLKTIFNGKEYVTSIYEDNYFNNDLNIKHGFFVRTNYLNDDVKSYYSDNNKLLKSTYNDLELCYSYKNDLVTKIEANNGEKIEYNYLNKSLVKLEKKYNDVNVLIVKNNYDDKNKFIDSYDLILENETRLNYKNTYTNDLLTKITLNDAIVDDEETFIEILKSEYKYDALNRVQHQKITSDKVNVCNEYSYLQQDNNSLDLISEDILKIEIDNNNQKSYLSETHTYEYDVNGNITSISDDETKNRYEYDELSRLIREDNRLLNKTVIYKYDKAGNIILKKNYDYSLNDNISMKPLDVYEYIYDCDNRDRLISYNDKLFDYDEYGRPIIYKGNNLIWNNNQLSRFNDIYYKYDVNGIRNKKIINGKETTYITNGTQILQMKNDNGKFIFHYILNKLVGFEYTNTSSTREYLYIRNIQGDITSIIDVKGNIICTYAYDGYGNHIVLDENGKEDTSLTSIGHLNPFRYRGYYFDEESGLYYLNNRYYDPETGRFISPDVLSILDETKGQINGLNLYMYCGDNPIMYIDSNGCFAISFGALLSGILIGVGIGASIGFISAAYSDYKDDGILFNGDLLNYIGSILGGAISGAGIGLASTLGAGLGMALISGEALIVFGASLSGSTALSIAAVGSFISGMVGYVARTGISNSEEFQLSHMFIEGTTNMASGLVSFVGGVCGGILQLKIPGATFNLKKFLLFQIGSAYFGVLPMKGLISLIKQQLEKRY